MQEPPTGTVTFLFTDIEGSTRLLDELGDEYVQVLAQLDRGRDEGRRLTLDEAIERALSDEG